MGIHHRRITKKTRIFLASNIDKALSRVPMRYHRVAGIRMMIRNNQALNDDKFLEYHKEGIEILKKWLETKFINLK